MKPKVSILVQHQYRFKTSKAPGSIRSNAKLAEMLLKDMNFIYQVRQCLCRASAYRALTSFLQQEARDGGKRHSPYLHPIIQEAINETLFRDKDDVGVVHHEHFSPMPIPIIALILTVVWQFSPTACLISY
jgi:hypothetical protein